MAKLGAALSYNPFEPAPVAEAKLGTPVDFNPFEAAGTPDEREINLPPLQGTPAPGVPLPLPRPADIPLPIPRPANLGEEAPVVAPLQASVAQSPALMPIGEADTGPTMEEEAPTEPLLGISPKKSFVSQIPGGLEVQKQFQSLRVAGEEGRARELSNEFKRAIDLAKSSGASQQEIDRLQAKSDEFDKKTGLLQPQIAAPLAALAKTEAEIKSQPQSEFSQKYQKVMEDKEGGIKDWVIGTYDAITSDPLGAAKSLTAGMVASAPQLAAFVIGGEAAPVTGGVYSAAQTYADALIDETVKRGGDINDPKKFQEVYNKYHDDIVSSAKNHGAVAGTFNAMIGAIPGGQTLLQGARNIVAMTAAQVAQAITENAITTVPKIDPKTQQPILDKDGNPEMVNIQELSPKEILSLIAQGVISAIPFEARHLFSGRKAATPGQSPGGAGTPPGGAGTESPYARRRRESTQSYNKEFPVENDSWILAAWQDEISLGRMTREQVLDRIAKMTPEEAAKFAADARQIGGKDLEWFRINAEDDAYLEKKRRELGTHGQAPGSQPSPEKPVEARGAGSPPPPEAAIDPISASILKGAGYDIEDIMGMSPRERDVEIRKAQRAKTKQADLTDDELATISGKPNKAEAPTPPTTEAPAAPAPEAPAAKATELVAQGVEPLEAMKEAAIAPEAAAPVITPPPPAQEAPAAAEIANPLLPTAPPVVAPPATQEVIKPEEAPKPVAEPTPPITIKPKRAPPVNFKGLVGFIKSIGGLKDEGGELKARDLHRVPGLVRANGLSIEDAVQRAVEEGFYPDDYNQVLNGEGGNYGPSRELIEQFKDDLKNKKQKPLSAEEASKADERRQSEEQEAFLSSNEEEVRNLLKEMDHTASDELIKDAAIAMIRDRKSAEEALHEVATAHLADALPGEEATIHDIVGDDFWDTVQQHLVDKEEPNVEPSPSTEVKPIGGETRQPTEQPPTKAEAEKPSEPIQKAVPEKPIQKSEGPITLVEKKRINLGPVDGFITRLKLSNGKEVDIYHQKGDGGIHLNGWHYLNKPSNQVGYIGENLQEAIAQVIEDQNRLAKTANVEAKPEAKPAETETPAKEVTPELPTENPVVAGKEIPNTGLFIEQKKVKLSPNLESKKFYYLLDRYFTPGNIIHGYGGSKDKVVSYSLPNEKGRWSVTVQGVNNSGELERLRNHSTRPSNKNLREVLGNGIEKDFVVTGNLIKNKALLDKLGFEPIRTVDGVQQRIFIGADPTESIKAASQPTIEAGAEGKPQTVIPGAEKISEKEQAQRGVEKGLKPKVEQKEPGGLFGDESKQKDLMDLLSAEPKAPAEVEAPVLPKEEPPAPVPMHTNRKDWIASPEQFSKSPNMPDEYLNVLRDWAKMLGIKGKIHLMLDTDVKNFDFSPYKSIARHLKNADGLRTWYPLEKSSIITLVLKPRKSFNLETLAHELGHHFQREVFDNASDAEKNAIMDDYKRFLKEQKVSTVEQYVKALRPYVTGKTGIIPAKMAPKLASTALRPYWRSFNEWFADQTARYMMSEERPQSVVGKFFGRIADGLKRLYQSLAGMQGKARKSMKDYLDRRINENIFDSAELKDGEATEEPVTEASSNSFDDDTIDEINQMNAANGMNNGPKAPVKKSFQEPEQGLFGKARAKYQDEFIYQKKVQEAIEKSRGSTIPDNLDVYVNANLLPNKVSHRMEEIQREEAEPLFKRMKQLGVTKDELGIYAYALAAPERNALIAARDPKTPDGGSGMMNATATQIISKLSGKKKELDELMNMVYDIRDKDLQEAVDNGRLSQADADALSKSSPHYLPLFGFAEGTRSEDARFNYQNIGKGISITPAEWAKSTGRTSIAQNPVINMILRRQEGAYRSEKNSAAKALYLLAKQNPNPDLWVVNKPVMKKIINEHGLVEWEPQGMITPNTVVAKMGGKPYYITLRNEELAQAFKKIGINAQGQFWRTFGEVNRYFSQLQTGKNLNFAAKNVSRDFTDALFYGIMKDPMLAAHFVAQYIPTLVATVRVHAGIASQAQKDAYNKFSASGGKLNFYTGRGDAERIAENINRITGKLDPLTFNNMPKRVGSALWNTLNLIPNLMEKINAPIEEATRHAVFNAALKRGYTEQQAGYTALESTGNFTRRGSETSKINAYKWFFNATLQPNFTYAGLLKSKKGQVVFASLVAAGFANAMRNLAMSDDNEVSGQNNYLDIPNYQRSGSIIVKYGKGAKDYVPIPVGSFVNLPFYLGGQLAIGLTGSQPYMTTATDTMLGAFYSYAPWLNSPLAQILAPSIGAPIVDILTNKTFTGSPVHPPEGQYNVGVPKSGQESKETLPQITEFTKWLNSSTKGTAITPGMLDLYPDDIQHIMKGLAGGAGASTVQTYNYIGNTIMGNPIKPEDTPIISGLQPAKITNAANYYTYHEQIREKENQAREAFKQLKSSPSPEKYSALAEALLPFNATMSSNGIDWTHSYAIKAMNASDAILKNLRKDRMDVKKDFSTSSLQRQNKIEEIDRQIDDTMGAAAKMMSIFQEKPPNGPLSIYGKSR